MKLDRMLENLPMQEIVGSMDKEVKGISLDSRRIGHGDLFACLRGASYDGHDFAQDAVARGASVVLCDHRLEISEATQVIASDVRKVLARIAARFYGKPSHDLKVVGVTGTNGKTTTVHLVRSILIRSGIAVGIMGTLGHWISDEPERDVFTTPEAPHLQRYMSKMVKKGMTHCVMEVSSHAIALRRVDCVDFDVVAFTNLSHDHLDFHGDFETYRKTKMRLFGIDEDDNDYGEERVAVVNVTNKDGRQICEETPLEKLTFALGEEAAVKGEISELDWHGTRMKISSDGKTFEVTSKLRGRSNAENIVAAFAIARALGIEHGTIVEGIASMEIVPGRMEMISAMGRVAIVDYAHTPDALRRLLTDIRSFAPKRIICVFGCGGDRDRGKRPEMGRIASELSDLTIITSDNPRTENPHRIIQDILEGVVPGKNHFVEPDRAQAIRRAVEMSKPGDVVVVAGKGHEDYQIIGNTRIPFDDREAVRSAFGVKANAES